MLVSIIITSYNYEKYIKECVDSCLNQINFNSYEIIIVDDGSTDNTKKILSEYQDNNKIKIFYNKNNGIEYSCNFAIKKSMSDYIVRVDADDTLKKDFLSISYSKILLHKCSFVYSNYDIINKNNEIIKSVNLLDFNYEEILSRGDFLATGTLYKKSIIDNVGLYNEKTINSGLENYELIIKLLINDYKGFHISTSLFNYRRHGSNISDLKKEKIIDYGNDLFENLNIGKYMTNEFHPYGLIIND